MGDSRGHWDGNTLVVVTKNLNGMTGVGGNGGGRSSDRLTITERFTHARQGHAPVHGHD